MILYDLPAGMHPRRVRIFLAEKGVSLPTKVVDAAKGENKTNDFLRMNPMGLLPVLHLDNGTALAESLAICRYIETLHPHPPLWGEVSTPIVEIFRHSGDFYRGRIVQVPAYAEWLREQIVLTLKWLDGELAGRPFIAGSQYTMADIVAQCAFVLGKAVGIRIPSEQTNLARWFAEVTARPTARA
jgi:glutathione S-transferase